MASKEHRNGSRRDPIWKYCEEIEDMSSYSGCSSRGIKHHLDRFKENKRDDQEMIDDEERNKVCLDIGRFFYENGIPFDVATSPSFATMLHSIRLHGPGLEPPTMDEMNTWILKEEVKTTDDLVNNIKVTWKSTGVSLLLDGWSDVRNKSLINFVVNNQYGNVYLKTVNASDCLNNAQKLFEVIDGVIEEIGEETVIQVVTKNTNAYKAAGTLLMEKRKSLYWTPCAAHCIDMMLEETAELPQVKNVLLQAKKVSKFIHKHKRVLSFSRKYLKKDLRRTGATRFATVFFTLENMYQLKYQLEMMFVSTEWFACPWANKPDGIDVKMIIMDDTDFWPSVDYAIKITKPLLHVMSIVDGKKTPAMPFIYGAMNECKEKIANNLDGDVSSYKEIWDIIDQKWKSELHSDLHSAAYYLNPRFRWSPNVSEHPVIKTGLLKCMERFIPDEDIYLKADLQLDEYTYKQGLFGFRSSLSSYLTRPPIEWWDNFGDEVPELKSFATKILGLNCSASICEHNWNMLNQVHTKKRNRLITDKMNSLMYIMYNKKLKQKFLEDKKIKEEDDSENGEDESSASGKRKKIIADLVDEDDDIDYEDNGNFLFI